MGDEWVNTALTLWVTWWSLTNHKDIFWHSFNFHHNFNSLICVEQWRHTWYNFNTAVTIQNHFIYRVSVPTMNEQSKSVLWKVLKFIHFPFGDPKKGASSHMHESNEKLLEDSNQWPKYTFRLSGIGFVWNLFFFFFFFFLSDVCSSFFRF